MNTVVNFEIAKLLKEKGFNLPTRSYRQKSAIISSEKILPLVSVEEPYDWNNYSSEVPYYSMPTIGEVVMWLYEKYGIWIAVNRVVIGSDEWGYGYIISYLPKEYEFEKRRSKHLVEIQSFKEGVGSYHGAWYTPTEAYEAAIKYTLENLIQGGNNEQQ